MNPALALAAVSLLSAPAPSDLAAALDPALEGLVRDLRLPGLALGVVRDGEVVYARGFGEASRGGGTPVTTRSIFHMASVSKPFTATAVMQLVEAGKLELDMRLVEVLPYFRLADEGSLEITLRQMLTHTSGFPDVHDYQWDQPQHDEGAAERYARSLTGEQLLYPPGQGSRYSNMAFDVLAAVIAKASGQSFEDYVRTRILEPVGMHESSFIHAETPEEHRTQGHSSAFSERIDQAPCPVYPYNRRHAPSSTLNSNVEDMCRWMLANLARGELDGKRFLATESFDVMWSRNDDNPAIGLSWSLDEFEGRLLVSHSGSDVGFNSFCGFLPDEDLGVVVMVNSDRSPIGDLLRGVLRAALGQDFDFPGPSVGVEFAHVLETEDIDTAFERYFELREAEAGSWSFDFGELDGVRAALLRKERVDEALQVAMLNADEHSALAEAHVRLGELLAHAGDLGGARESYEHALRLAPQDADARAKLAELRTR